MKTGDRFIYKNIEFICLDIINGNYLAMTAKPFNRIPFDIEECNDWRNSSLRSVLNTDFLDLLDKKDLMKQTSDLIAENGDRAYGVYHDYVTILSCDQYRKYRDLVPLFDEWMWTLTPWNCNTDTSHSVLCVSTVGNVAYVGVYVNNGVAPVVLFNKDTFDKINVGDEVCYKDEPNDKFIVTHIDDSLWRISGFNSDGTFSNRPMNRWTKTGRHFPEIKKIFNELNEKGLKL